MKLIKRWFFPDILFRKLCDFFYESCDGSLICHVFPPVRLQLQSLQPRYQGFFPKNSPRWALEARLQSWRNVRKKHQERVSLRNLNHAIWGWLCERVTSLCTCPVYRSKLLCWTKIIWNTYFKIINSDEKKRKEKGQGKTNKQTNNIELGHRIGRRESYVPLCIN